MQHGRGLAVASSEASKSGGEALLASTACEKREERGKSKCGETKTKTRETLSLPPSLPLKKKAPILFFLFFFKKKRNKKAGAHLSRSPAFRLRSQHQKELARFLSMPAPTPSSAAVVGLFAREATATTTTTPSSSFDDVDGHQPRRESRFHTPLSATPSVLSALEGGSSANRDSATKSRGASRWVREKEREDIDRHQSRLPPFFVSLL